jgi:Fe2+ transport system protein B
MTLNETITRNYWKRKVSEMSYIAPNASRVIKSLLESNSGSASQALVEFKKTVTYNETKHHVAKLITKLPEYKPAVAVNKILEVYEMSRNINDAPSEKDMSDLISDFTINARPWIDKHIKYVPKNKRKLVEDMNELANNLKNNPSQTLDKLESENSSNPNQGVNNKQNTQSSSKPSQSINSKTNQKYDFFDSLKNHIKRNWIWYIIILIFIIGIIAYIINDKIGFWIVVATIAMAVGYGIYKAVKWFLSKNKEEKPSTK